MPFGIDTSPVRSRPVSAGYYGSELAPEQGGYWHATSPSRLRAASVSPLREIYAGAERAAARWREAPAR